MSDLLSGISLVHEYQPRHEKAYSYYEGTQPEVFASNRMRRLLESTGSRFRINFARTPVNAVLNRLEIAAIQGRNKTAQNVIDKMWEDNELHTEVPDFHRWGLVYGECYAIVWPDDEDDSTVVINYNSPLTTKIVYDEENPRRKRYAIKTWGTLNEKGEKRVRVNLYYPDRFEKWISTTDAPRTDRDFVPYHDSFVEDEEGEVVPQWPVPNPYGKIPVFHFRTQKTYGRPEHLDAFGPQDMVNKIVINQMASSDYHAFPQRYVLAGSEDSDEIEQFGEEFGVAEDQRSESADLTSGPGELWWLQGRNLEVGQFGVGDPDAFLKPLVQYVKAMSSTSDTPLHYFEGMTGVPSGEALRSAEAPLNKKVELRQTTFGSTWREVFSFILEIKGVPKTEVSVRWMSPQSMDDADTWTVVRSKIDAGMPMQTAFEEAGYNPEEVAQFVKDEITQLRRAHKAGEAARALGSAVTLGILSPQEAAEWMPVGTGTQNA